MTILLTGLGNPGARYQQTRHNVGFMAVDAVAHRHNFSPFKTKFSGELAEGTIAGQKALLFKPQRFMNLSGIPVAELAGFYKIPLEVVTVIHDDLDLTLGKLRIKRGGGDGGHNGLKSLDAHLGKDYQRLRVGIAHPGDKDRVADYVLSDFTPDEQEAIQPVLAAIAEHIGLLIQGDAAGFLNKVVLVKSGRSSVVSGQ